MEDMLVSVLMAVKNEADYIKEAIESVQQQSHSSLEIIVVDDHSDDATCVIVEEMAASDSRIVLGRARGHGKVSAFNLAWEMSHGDVVVLFAGDDVMPQDSIANRVHLLQERKLPVSTGKVKSFSTDAKYDGLILPRSGPSLGGGSTAFSREFSNLVFPIPEVLPNEDSWTKLHIEAFAEGVAWNDKIVSYYRIHEGNSMAFGAPFQMKRSVLDQRGMVYDIFLEKYKGRLSQSFRTHVESLARLNRLRSEGKVLGIALLPRVPLKQKSAAISYATPLLYSLRVALERHLLGR